MINIICEYFYVNFNNSREKSKIQHYYNFFPLMWFLYISPNFLKCFSRLVTLSASYVCWCVDSISPHRPFTNWGLGCRRDLENHRSIVLGKQRDEAEAVARRFSVIKVLQTCNLFKKDSDTGVLLWTLRNFWKQLFL